MDCKDARQTVWPPERLQIADEAVANARAHIDECTACQDYLTQDGALLDAYDRFRGERAPRRVRERVFDALARERAGIHNGSVGAGRFRSMRSTWLVGAAAALVVLSVGGTTLAMSDSATQQADALFVEDYLRRAVGEDNINTSDPGEVRRFLARELGMKVELLEMKGLRLAGAEICLVDGYRGAMVRYRAGDRDVSHYMIPKDGAKERSPTASPGVDVSSAPGSPAVVTWATPSIEQALVGELSEARLIALAAGPSALEL